MIHQIIPYRSPQQMEEATAGARRARPAVSVFSKPLLVRTELYRQEARIPHPWDKLALVLGRPARNGVAGLISAAFSATFFAIAVRPLLRSAPIGRMAAFEGTPLSKFHTPRIEEWAAW